MSCHNKIFFGVDYYPEHWPKERLYKDSVLMEELGVDVVRMAEFSWAKLEPSLNNFCFDWLDNAIEELSKHGIKTVLGTPTAAPPAWIVRADLDILPVDSNGIRREFGGRHHDCQSNTKYRAHIKRIVTAMANYYKDNKNVIGWQIDNELGNSHEDLCMCDSCQNRFRAWLKDKYKDVKALNTAWGTCFWSQDYSCFNEIGAPRLTVTGQNPSQMLDWRRFCSDLIVEFNEFQCNIIREICPNHFITHNLMGFADKVNYVDLGKSLDFLSHDQYPMFTVNSLTPGKHAAANAAPVDFIRSLKKRNIWIMEQQSGPSGWYTMSHTPRPGQLSLWAVQSIAHGADTVVFFRWRSCSVGTEQYWHGILPHSGIPGRAYDELKGMIKELKPVLNEIQGVYTKSDVGILYSYDQEYAFRIQPQNERLKYNEHVQLYYNAFHKKNIPVDYVFEGDDFSGYKLIVAPLQYIMTPALEDKFFEYVKNGGKLVLTMRAGVKDGTNLCMTDMPLPGKLGALCGISIYEYDCLDGVTNSVQMEDEIYGIDKWADLITLNGAESLAEYSSQYYKGTSAITKNTYGSGTAYYVGTEPNENLLDALVSMWKKDADLGGTFINEDGIEMVVRNGNDANYLFVLNHNERSRVAVLPDGYKCEKGNLCELAPYSYRIIKKSI